MKFKALVATAKADLNGGRFSEEALQQLALAGPRLLTFSYGPTIGIVRSASLTTEGVEVLGEVWAEYDIFRPERTYVAPGLACRKKTHAADGDHYEDMMVTGYAVTGAPADPNLTPMQEIVTHP